MDCKAKCTNLNSEVDCLINYFSRKQTKTKRRAYTLRISSVIFSAMITVVLGITTNNGMEDVLRNVAIFLGAFVSIINAVDAFYNYNALWIKNAVTLSRLRALRTKISFYAAGFESEDMLGHQLNGYLEELQSILKDDIKQWLRIKERANSMEQNKENVSYIDMKLRSIKEKSVDKSE
jgi:ABC-type multidrug transport system fused ATPase/permease subunit